MSRVRHRLILRPGREASVAGRHPWIFSGAVERVESLPDAVDGDLCDLMDSKGRWLARGTLHRSSQIVCRILTFRDEPIDAGFFRRRLEEAEALRRVWIDPERTDSYRLVNAEADRLPGLIVDRYADCLVTQCLTSGMDRLTELWCEALDDLFRPRVIVDRRDRATRDAALAGRREAIRGTMPGGPVWIREEGLRFRVSLDLGQKTGFYLDQRENRSLVRSLAAGRRVLNGFAYTGGFGVFAGAGGASRVVQVESSPWALEEARVHWRENGLDEERVGFVREDLFRFLRSTEESYDLIVLDPPPYAKDRGSVDRAARAYKDLNLWGLRRLRPGGLLLTFSCSQHIGPDLFQKILFGAALDARASCQWIRRLGPAADHPVHLDHPQGEYLKGFMLRLIERDDAAVRGAGGPRSGATAGKDGGGDDGDEGLDRGAVSHGDDIEKREKPGQRDGGD